MVEPLCRIPESNLSLHLQGFPSQSMMGTAALESSWQSKTKAQSSAYGDSHEIKAT